jgi:hypothetical protein
MTMETTTHYVTCRTDGCANADARIPVTAIRWDDAGRELGPDPAPFVVCGVCGVPITDVEPVTP